MTRPFTIAAAAGLAGLLCLSGGAGLRAQNRMTFPIVAEDSGHIALGLALRRLNVSGTFMQTAAHPDDEHNALFALFGRGMGLRAIDVQTNRGEGGQNEIGPELFRDIGVLRTSELLSAHRIDGAEQYFTRAIDYGYSFDPQEVIGKWGREAIVGDFVRLIRTFRPDVLLTMNIQGRGGDRAHEATTRLVREAYRGGGESGEVSRTAQGGAARVAAGEAVLHRRFRRRPRRRAAERREGDAARHRDVRSAARPHVRGHRRRRAQLPQVPGHDRTAGAARLRRRPWRRPRLRLRARRDVDSRRDGEDRNLVLRRHRRQPVGARALRRRQPARRSDLRARRDRVRRQRAQKAFADGDGAGTASPVEAGLAAIRALRAKLGAMGLDDNARYELDTRLAVKERDYEDAVIAAHGLTFDAVADDGLVIGGQTVKLSLLAVNHGATSVEVTSVGVSGFDGVATCQPGAVKKDAVYTCGADLRVPANAPPTTPYFSDHYWKTPSNPAINVFAPGVPFGVPFAPTPFRVTYHVKAGSGRGHARGADRIPLREGHLSGRQAHGAERRARAVGGRDAGPRGHSVGGRGASRGARSPRDGDQRHEGRGRGAACASRRRPAGR